ncbi:MAG: M23 family metallopeptidase [Myxococcota bacterium]
MPPSPRIPASPTPLDLALWGGLGLLLAVLLGTSTPVDARTAPLAAMLKYRHLPVAQHFDFPVGGPDAAGYHCAQEFGENLHLGEDWNSNTGDDLGEPVTTIARGEVTYAAHAGPPWGNVVRVVHHVRRQGRSSFVESVYAHLDRIDVEAGASLDRGARVGTIGDADGRYGPHLHLEVRRAPDLPLGPGYSSRNRAWLDPTAFILDHR